MNFLEKIQNARETRAKSPEFQAAMAQEKIQTKEILSDLGKNGLAAGATILFKAPTKIFLDALKMVYKKKYGLMSFSGDTLKTLFWKDGVAHQVIKVVANALHLAGHGAKVGVRNLLAV